MLSKFASIVKKYRYPHVLPDLQFIVDAISLSSFVIVAHFSFFVALLFFSRLANKGFQNVGC